MNCAQLSILIAFFGCGISAAMTAVNAGAGWFTILYLAAGLVIGLATAYLIHHLANYFLFSADKIKNPWLSGAMIAAYMFLPMALAVCVIVGTGKLTSATVKYLSTHVLFHI